MLFQSFEFLVFLPVIFLLYWFVFNKNLKAQNILLLIASYFFYGWWDWRFLSLIAFSSVVDYIVGNKIGFHKNNNEDRKAKIYLTISLVMNLGLLGVFKYFNFFIDSFQDITSLIGFQTNISSLQIILPVGISFYTFQTLSYSIDVYRGHIKPTKDIIVFFTFVSFFPQLVAGPIERATNLLPQFLKNRKFNYEQTRDGLLQILAGLFKKLVIADTCAIYVNQIFDSNEELKGSVLLLGAIYFAFQIYGDFSGYSDIAIGVSKLFGFKLMTNFKTPYFSRDISEFWRRWHISLSTWFRDYLYIPLGGSRGGKFQQIKNTFIIFIVSGFWHGANWTFVFWGAINAIYFLPLLLLGKNRNYLDAVASGKLFPSFKEIFQIGITFFMTCIAWVFFRAENVTSAFTYISGIFSKSLFEAPDKYRTYLPLLCVFVIIEWINREKDHLLQFSSSTNIVIRWSFYYTIFFAVLYNLSGEQVKFIYFDF